MSDDIADAFGRVSSDASAADATVVSKAVVEITKALGDSRSPLPPGFRMDDPVLVVHHRQLPDADVMLLDGVVVTTVLRTLLDVIDSQFDEELVASVVDDALDKGAISERQLRRRLDELDSAARTRAERVLARESRDVPVSAEPAALRLIGYWRSEFDENRRPDPRDFVDPTWSEAERNMVAGRYSGRRGQ